MVAARSGNPEVVEQLLAQGANMNARAARGQTALMWAVAQKHAEVVKVLLAHGADVHARSEVWTQMDGRSAAWPSRLQPGDPARRRHGADVCGARRRSRLGEAAGRRRRQRERRGRLGRQRHCFWPRTPASEISSSSCSTRAPIRTRPTPASPRSTRRSCAATRAMVRALLAHGADPTLRCRPGRRRGASRATSISSPSWSERRRSGWPPASRSRRDAPAREARRRSAVRASQRPDRGRTRGNAYEHRNEATTALMAAVGMGGGGMRGSSRTGASAKRSTLEAVKLAVELGVDVNAANTDGRTALDAAKPQVRIGRHLSVARAPSPASPTRRTSRTLASGARTRRRHPVPVAGSPDLSSAPKARATKWRCARRAGAAPTRATALEDVQNATRIRRRSQNHGTPRTSRQAITRVPRHAGKVSEVTCGT